MVTIPKRLRWEALAAVVWCLVTLATDRLFFRYDWRTPAFFVYKILFVLAAFAVVHGLVTLVDKVRRRDAFILCWLRWMLPYLAVTLVVLLIVWPGCWGSDDLDVLYKARTLTPAPWQSFLTSAVFILCLMFLPLPGGLVLIQTLLIAGVVGFFLAAAQTLAAQRLRRPVAAGWFAILYLPFLLPPVVLHDMQPFRTTWATWTELFTVALLVWWHARGEQITRGKLAWFTLLGFLTAAWRSESIYYLAALPVLLAFLVHKKAVRPVGAVVSSVVIVAATLVSTAYNNRLMGDAWTYQNVALCYQAAALVQDADPVEDAEELAMIDPVYDVQACRENSNLHGPELRTLVTRSIYTVTEQQWSDCKKAIVRLALKYPSSLLRERMGMFLNTVEQQQTNSNQKLVFAATVLVYTDDPDAMRDTQKDFLYNSVAAYPINQTLREDFIMSLSYRTEFLFGIPAATWLMLPSFGLFAAALVVLLVRRRWMWFFAAGAIFARIPLVFLTTPDTYFMYYLTPYIAGYALTAAGIVYAVLCWKKKQERGKAQ